MSTLFLVATPIGNLEDMSIRALRVLREVRLVAAEDTRQSGKLLSHFDIHTPLVSYHEHNKLVRLERILAELEHGDVALISDAGTPALNDPGYELVREVLQAGHAVSPIPGPSAPLAALVASGLPTDAFLYLGYLPRKSAERQRLLARVAEVEYTLIFLETPHRLLSALQDLLHTLGNRQVAVARELTKLYEEIYRGTLEQAYQHFSKQPPRGEFTLVVAGQPADGARWPADQVKQAVLQAKQSGEPTSQAARRLAAESGWKKGEIYALLLNDNVS